MKKSLFNKFLGIVIPSLLESKSELTTDELEEQEKFSLDPNDPADVTFAKVFTKNGGKFFYCDDVENFRHNLKSLLQESPWQKPYCSDQSVRDILAPIDFFYEDNHQNADFAISTCEFLVGFNGAIMVSGEQTKNVKIEALPDTLIIVAYTSQIVKNIGEGLRGVQTKYGNKHPVVTTIRTKDSVSMISDTDRAKDLYVFLVEDFKEHR